MNAFLWASIGTVVGLLASLLLRIWQRKTAGGASPAPARRGSRPGRVEHRPPGTRRLASTSGKPGKPLNRRQTRKFHGVSLKPCLHACKAVQALSGQRFLPEEAPAFPLPGCEQDECRCGYYHHGDRRDAEDRRSGWGGFGGFAPSIPGGNRRGGGRDRRS